MDEQNSISNIAAGTGIATGIASFLASFFYVSRHVGEMQKTVKQHGDDIKQHSDDIASIKELFTKDGEPRFVTYSAHDKMQESCQGLMNARLGNIEKQMGKHDEKLDKILDCMAGLPRNHHDK